MILSFQRLSKLSTAMSHADFGGPSLSLAEIVARSGVLVSETNEGLR